MLLCVKLSFLCISLGLIYAFYRIIRRFHPRYRFTRMSAKMRLVLSSAVLMGAIFCLRYAVGIYMGSTLPAEIYPRFNGFEEAFNSVLHTLQTFSMDEDYTLYIDNGKKMIQSLPGYTPFWGTAFGIYQSSLNVLAPVAGGAIIFEIIASFFPRIRLYVSSLFLFFKEKIYFSELNESSLALAKSIRRSHRWWQIGKPQIIFTDTYVDKDNEKSSEMANEAKMLGAILVQDDLTHLAKFPCLRKKYILIDQDEMNNLKTLTALADDRNYSHLKYAEVFLFSQNDIYTDVEFGVREKLRNKYKFKPRQMPVIVPVQSNRNLVWNLLSDLPLYEALVGKRLNAAGKRDLNVTILGSGGIGTEMLLSTFWCGQMLDCNLHIRIISNENKDDFCRRINYINPEILRSCAYADPLLKTEKKKDPIYAPPYADIDQIEYDVCLNDMPALLNTVLYDNTTIGDSDYFFVALGSDESNLSVAKKLREEIGRRHMAVSGNDRCVIAYVIFDADICQSLNAECSYSYSAANSCDIYMRAVGSLADVYSVRSVFMTDLRPLAQKADEAYNAKRNKKDLRINYNKRIKDPYAYYSNLARSVHLKYKIFSSGKIDTSVFDTGGFDNEQYKDALHEAAKRFIDAVSGSEYDIQLLHRLAWLEHRRWNAFMRTKGFCGTDVNNIEKYCKKTGSHKQIELKLHPCIVECDEKGIRGPGGGGDNQIFDEKGNLMKAYQLKCEDSDKWDLLDAVSYKVRDLVPQDENNEPYDFKLYDYPSDEVGMLTKKDDTFLPRLRKLLIFWRK